MAVQAPKNPDRLPSLEHNGQEITVLRHYGFSLGGSPRMLYAMKDNNGERHWRRTLEEVQILIERNASPD